MKKNDSIIKTSIQTHREMETKIKSPDLKNKSIRSNQLSHPSKTKRHMKISPSSHEEEKTQINARKKQMIQVNDQTNKIQQWILLASSSLSKIKKKGHNETLIQKTQMICVGKCLFDHKREKLIPNAYKVGQQIATQLYHLHNAGISHNDIKLKNICWDPLKQCATLIDFEWATYLNENRSKENRAGTIKVFTTFTYSGGYFFKKNPEAVGADDSQGYIQTLIRLTSQKKSQHNQKIATAHRKLKKIGTILNQLYGGKKYDDFVNNTKKKENKEVKKTFYKDIRMFDAQKGLERLYHFGFHNIKNVNRLINLSRIFPDDIKPNDLKKIYIHLKNTSTLKTIPDNLEAKINTIEKAFDISFMKTKF